MPSFFTVLIVTTWSCFIFKRDYAGRDAGLNRRIISVPLIMPIIISVNTVINFGIFDVADHIPHFYSWTFVYHLTVSIKITVALLNELSTGLCCPFLVLFLYPQLRMSWVKLFKSTAQCNIISKQKDNRVHPTDHP